jgi:hypothetical protein
MMSSCLLLLWSTYKTPSRPVLKSELEDFDLDVVRLPIFLVPSSMASLGPRHRCHTSRLHYRAWEPSHPAPPPSSPSSPSRSFTAAPGTTPPALRPHSPLRPGTTLSAQPSQQLGPCHPAVITAASTCSSSTNPLPLSFPLPL